jgi:hypothetical protein
MEWNDMGFSMWPFPALAIPVHDPKIQNILCSIDVFSFSSNFFHVLSENGSVNYLSTLSK